MIQYGLKNMGNEFNQRKYTCMTLKDGFGK